MPAKKKTTPQLSPCQKRSNDLLVAALKNPEIHYTKGLPHATDGAPKATPYAAFVEALRAVNSAAPNALGQLDSVEKGVQIGGRNMVNPLSGWSTDLQISDPCCYQMPEPPSVTSAEEAAELIELYWMALLRDVPFVDWKNHSGIRSACEELSGLPLYPVTNKLNQSPAETNYVKVGLNADTVFRGGELDRLSDESLESGSGPFVSQFLLKDVVFGTQTIQQKNEVAAPGINYMTDFEDWLDVQNGAPRNPRLNRHVDKRYIATMRDLASYVHFDQLFQPYLSAALILLDGNYPSAGSNPYGTGSSQHGAGQAIRSGTSRHPNQDGFGTFGGPHILSLVTEVAQRALKVSWRTKWTHLRIRPEGYAGYVHRSILMNSRLSLGSGEEIIAKSAAVNRLYQTTATTGRSRGDYNAGSLLLPMAFPEGSPTHPAYAAGHATVAAACVTMLKAFFDEWTVMRDPVVADRDGLSLLPYLGSDSGKLTVGYELDKLAYNVANGRNMAGVHWRSDTTQSFLLGQRLAVDMLMRQSSLYRESYEFNFRSFAGNEVTIESGNIKIGSINERINPDESCGIPDFLFENLF